MARLVIDKKAIKADMTRSFFSGVRSATAIQGTTGPVSLRTMQSDCIAIYGDWARVGRQLSKAVRAYKS